MTRKEDETIARPIIFRIQPSPIDRLSHDEQQFSPITNGGRTILPQFTATSHYLGMRDLDEGRQSLSFRLPRRNCLAVYHCRRRRVVTSRTHSSRTSPNHSVENLSHPKLGSARYHVPQAGRTRTAARPIQRTCAAGALSGLLSRGAVAYFLTVDGSFTLRSFEAANLECGKEHRTEQLEC
jgi:hypothetical protein